MKPVHSNVRLIRKPMFISDCFNINIELSLKGNEAVTSLSPLTYYDRLQQQGAEGSLVVHSLPVQLFAQVVVD